MVIPVLCYDGVEGGDVMLSVIRVGADSIGVDECATQLGNVLGVFVPSYGVHVLGHHAAFSVNISVSFCFVSNSHLQPTC